MQATIGTLVSRERSASARPPLSASARLAIEQAPAAGRGVRCQTRRDRVGSHRPALSGAARYRRDPDVLVRIGDAQADDASGPLTVIT